MGLIGFKFVVENIDKHFFEKKYKKTFSESVFQIINT